MVISKIVGSVALGALAFVATACSGSVSVGTQSVATGDLEAKISSTVAEGPG